MPLVLGTLLLFGAAVVVVGALSPDQTRAFTSARRVAQSALDGAALHRSLSSAVESATKPASRRTVIAWQPSHQADTGVDWEEHVVCADIVDRAMALLPEFVHVKAWETGMGLTGSNAYRPRPVNTPAFDSEIEMANRASAEVFISVHNDGGAPSGILGMCMPDDSASHAFVESLKNHLIARTGLADRGVREQRLYSLEPERNEARLRVLLEIGDNRADRAFLLDPANRQIIAEALAEAIRGSELP